MEESWGGGTPGAEGGGRKLDGKERKGKEYVEARG